MTASLALALLVQVVGVFLLRNRLGRKWLRRPVVLLYLTSVLYQGVSAVMLAFPSICSQDAFRDGIAGASLMTRRF